jgi:catechol 2,3-dioxygenase-like lactoylglutathione lyase family enzyme
MPTIRINASQKINVHGADWPQRPGYLGARRPTVSGADFCLEWEGTIQEVYFRDPDGNLVEFTVYSGQG